MCVGRRFFLERGGEGGGILCFCCITFWFLCRGGCLRRKDLLFASCWLLTGAKSHVESCAHVGVWEFAPWLSTPTSTAMLHSSKWQTKLFPSAHPWPVSL